MVRRFQRTGVDREPHCAEKQKNQNRQAQTCCPTHIRHFFLPRPAAYVAESGAGPQAPLAEIGLACKRWGMSRLKRTIALVGMMGAGKSSVGRRLAAKLDVEFRDADAEIETAAGCSINDIFDRFGEPAFRDGERKIIARLLALEPHVLATGGGAFVDPNTQARIKDVAVSVWIKVPLEVLLARVQRRDTRPLLRNGEPREILEKLLAEREPFYAQADIIVESENGPHNAAVDKILAALEARGDLG